MNYAKLMLAVAGGVLLAAGVIGVVFWLRDAPKREAEASLRAAQVQLRKEAREFECRQPRACLDEKLADAKALVTDKLASAEQAAKGFCEATVVKSDNAARAKQQMDDCVAETLPKMR